MGPYYNKPTPEGFYRHFAAVADASTAPVVVYNVPGRTGSNIDNATMLQAGPPRQHRRRQGGLGEPRPDHGTAPGSTEGFGVLSGDDAFALAVMALGGDGVISVVANQVPGEMHALAAAAGKRQLGRGTAHPLPAAQAHESLNFIESNPIPVKASLALMGLCEPSWRLPLCAPRRPATEEALRAALTELGLIS